MAELFCLGRRSRRRITRAIYAEVSCTSLISTKLVQRANTCNKKHSVGLLRARDCDATDLLARILRYVWDLFGIRICSFWHCFHLAFTQATFIDI